MNPRQGFTLVELLIAMGAATVLLGVSVGLVHRAMTAHTTSSNRVLLQQEALRLSRQLRSDLRHAESLSIAEKKIALTVRHAVDATTTSTLIYAFSDGFLLREQAGSDGRPSHREKYRFPSATLAAEDLSDSQRVAIRLIQGNSTPDAPSRTVLHVEATVGSRLMIRPQETAP